KCVSWGFPKGGSDSRSGGSCPVGVPRLCQPCGRADTADTAGAHRPDLLCRTGYEILWWHVSNVPANSARFQRAATFSFSVLGFADLGHRGRHFPFALFAVELEFFLVLVGLNVKDGGPVLLDSHFLNLAPGDLIVLGLEALGFQEALACQFG